MMNNKKKIVISIVVMLAVVLGCFGIYSMLRGNQVASIVLLDVNPSIELKVDADADVIEANALNADAEKVLEGMKLKGMDADTAANAIIGSLLKNGYINEAANSILITVEDKNAVRGEKLQAELTEEINEILSATSVNAAVLAQRLEAEYVDDIADEYDISKGKAALIKNITEVNSTYEMKDLAKLSINELNLILSNPKNEVQNVVSTGSANDSAYIGREAAKKAALTHASVEEANAYDVEVDFDYEYGKMVYEVEFKSAEFEYDYSVDAESGEIIHSHREYNDDFVEEKQNANSNETTASETTAEDIGKEKAKAIAFEHAGTTESNASYVNVEREYDDGKLEYHVEFRVGQKEYEYEILAETGKIIDYDVDVENSSKPTSSTGTSNAGAENTNNTPSNTGTANTGTSNTEDIGKAAATSAALTHAGFTESQVTRLKVERDIDDGRIEYSVEFTANQKEYDYEIDGISGTILDYDIEREDYD